MRVLVTGSRGFIGKNLTVRLSERKGFSTLSFTREDPIDLLSTLVNRADAIVHLAGENRPDDVSAFDIVNVGLTETLCDAIRVTGKKIPLILASSIQADFDNFYGKSKHAAEVVVEELAKTTGSPVVIYRFPGVFGKWCKPNYNSVVATFCHNIANNIAIKINNPSTILRLVHIDDVVTEIMRTLQDKSTGLSRPHVEPEYSITIGELASQIEKFKNCRSSLISERVGTGLTRALYSTYTSYFLPDKFSYLIPEYEDDRGVFVEMLKTTDCGQFSFFTVLPGITRGGHYHHAKTEKFLVIKGSACFRYRNIVTQEDYELFTSGEEPRVVETIPGWAHNISNVGHSEMIVMLWANEIYDSKCPDTITCEV